MFSSLFLFVYMFVIVKGILIWWWYKQWKRSMIGFGYVWEGVEGIN